MTDEKTEVVVENAEAVTVDPKTAAPAPTPRAEVKPADDEATAALRQQLETARRATEAEKAARLNAERADADKARKLQEAEESAKIERQNAVLSSLEGATAECDSAKAALAEALAAGDYKKAAEEQERLSKAIYRVSDLEAKKGSLATPLVKTTEGRVTAPEPPQRQQQQDPIETYLAQFTPRTQSYLRQRPDVITDSRLNAKARWAHEEAQAQGLKPDTDDYFEFLDDQLGLGVAPAPKPKGADPVPPAPPPGQKRSATIAAAPPSRGTITPNGPGKVKVSLTEGQKRAARISGVTEQAYAEQLVKAEREGAFLTKVG